MYSTHIINPFRRIEGLRVPQTVPGYRLPHDTDRGPLQQDHLKESVVLISFSTIAYQAHDLYFSHDPKVSWTPISSTYFIDSGAFVSAVWKTKSAVKQEQLSGHRGDSKGQQSEEQEGEEGAGTGRGGG